MKISTDLYDFALHDGIVTKISYDKGNHTIKFDLILTDVPPPDAELCGIMLFHNVKEVHITGEYFDKEIHGNIINVEHLVRMPSETHEEVGWLIYIYLGQNIKQDVLSIEFLATDFDWIRSDCLNP